MTTTHLPLGNHSPSLGPPRPLIVICGPTASGKSALGVELARLFGGFIISADSRQIYRGMDIATGKLTREAMRGVRHDMIDIAAPDEEFTLAQYQQRVYALLQQLPDPIDTRAAMDLPDARMPAFLVGGTGLYINAVVDGYVIPAIKPNLALRAELIQKNSFELVELSRSLDPALVSCVDHDNKRRLIRYIEILKSGGSDPAPGAGHAKLSDGYAQHPPAFLRTLRIGIDVARDVLYQRINDRVDDMFAQGIVEEARRLLTQYDTSLPSMTGIGYLHIKSYLAGTITLEHCKELIKRDSRRYAKRQLTWFRADTNIRWIHHPSEAETLVREFLG